jgi:hypothetical protein
MLFKINTLGFLLYNLVELLLVRFYIQLTMKTSSPLVTQHAEYNDEHRTLTTTKVIGLKYYGGQVLTYIQHTI